MTYLLIEDDNTFNKFLFTNLEAGKAFWAEYRKLPYFIEKLCTVTEIEYDGEENEFYSVFYGEELPKVFGVDKGRDALNKAVKEFGLAFYDRYNFFPTTNDEPDDYYSHDYYVWDFPLYAGAVKFLINPTIDELNEKEI